MKIDPDGVAFAAVAALPAAVAVAARRPRTAAALGLVPLAVAAFFRDPDREPDRHPVDDHDVVLAPADGRVMHVGVPQPDVAPEGSWQQISIFLALTDVHINRTPVGGTVVDLSHRPGRYLAAFKPESAHRNERSELVVEDVVGGERRVVVFRQIVGMAARRVVTRVHVGDRLVPGQRIGLMRFGSRMDVFLPPEVRIEVAAGDRTVGGESVIARWPAPGRSAP